VQTVFYEIIMVALLLTISSAGAAIWPAHLW